jgi:hypothetical protein
MWDAYFAGRAAPLGRDVPAAVVHALFDDFADGEVARHIPRLWDRVTPSRPTRRVNRVRLRRCAGSSAISPTARASRARLSSSSRRGALHPRKVGRSTPGTGRIAHRRARDTRLAVLEPVEVARLVADLEPLVAVLVAAGSE